MWDPKIELGRGLSLDSEKRDRVSVGHLKTIMPTKGPFIPQDSVEGGQDQDG